MGNGPQALAAALLDAVYMADKLTEAQGRRVGYEHLQAACRLAASKLQEDAVFKDDAFQRGRELGFNERITEPSEVPGLLNPDVTEDEIDEDPAGANADTVLASVLGITLAERAAHQLAAALGCGAGDLDTEERNEVIELVIDLAQHFGFELPEVPPIESIDDEDDDEPDNTGEQGPEQA
jgi:hypothetical protein